MALNTVIMKKIQQLPSRLEEMAIGQIVFDHSEWVSLWGYMGGRDKHHRMDFILNFETLNKLLRLSGSQGDRIQMLLVERLEKGVEEPSVIDLEELYGSPLVLDQCSLEVSVTWVQDGDGGWKEDPGCLSIDEVSPLLEKKAPVLSPRAQCKQNFSRCVEQLTRSYALYLGYLELDMDEATALRKAGLEDDLKFKMAYYAWVMEQPARP